MSDYCRFASASQTMGYSYWATFDIANGRYSIQPMQDLSLALARSATNVINLNSEEFATDWGIIHNNFGYAIQYGGNASESARPVWGDILPPKNWFSTHKVDKFMPEVLMCPSCNPTLGLL